jgi:protocatechuate 3,4-dioxygenase beta subunit
MEKGLVCCTLWLNSNKGTKSDMAKVLIRVLTTPKQAGEDGLYSSQDPNKPKFELRGKFRSDRDGTYHIKSVLPKGYQIPIDGPVGDLMQATGRPPWRPAHLHFRVSAEGYQALTTHLFVKGAPHIHEDAVFGVKESLIQDFKRNLDGKGYMLNYSFILSQALLTKQRFCHRRQRLARHRHCVSLSRTIAML